MTPDSLPIAILFGVGALILMGVLVVALLRRPKPITLTIQDDTYSEKSVRDFSGLRKFKIEGKVIKIWDGPDEVLASGGCVKDAVSAEALKADWERDMKIAFPMGADYNVEYRCTITPLDDDEPDDDVVKAAIAAEVGALTVL